MDPSSLASEQPEEWSEAESEVESAASVHKPEPPESFQPEYESAPAPIRVEELELASARKRSKRPIKSTSQEKE